PHPRAGPEEEEPLREPHLSGRGGRSAGDGPGAGGRRLPAGADDARGPVGPQGPISGREGGPGALEIALKPGPADFLPTRLDRQGFPRQTLDIPRSPRNERSPTDTCRAQSLPGDTSPASGNKGNGGVS